MTRRQCSTADQLAALTAMVAAMPERTERPLSSAEIAAEDYWASVGEARRDEAFMGASARDSDRAADRYYGDAS